MNQNISAYMNNLRTKKWWWPPFQFVVDVAVNNAYQIYRQSHLNPGEYRLDAIVDAYCYLYRKSLSSSTLFTSSRSLHHPANNLQLTISITGLPRGHNDGVAYQDVKEPRYIIVKYAMSVFMLNVLNYIGVSRAVCKVYLRLIFWFSIFFSLSTHNSSNKTQNFKRSNKNISYKKNWKVNY